MAVDEWYPPPFFGECGVGEANALCAVVFYGAVCGFFGAGVAQGDEADDVCGCAACDALIGVGGVALYVVEVNVFGGEDGDVEYAVGAGAEECNGKEEEGEGACFHGCFGIVLFFVDGVAFYGAPDAAVDVGDVPPAGFYFGVGEAYAGGSVLLDGFVEGFFVVCFAGGDADDEVGGVCALFAIVDDGGVAGGVVHVYVFGGEEGEVCQAVAT